MRLLARENGLEHRSDGTNRTERTDGPDRHYWL
jgi:hypothetical protein